METISKQLPPPRSMSNADVAAAHFRNGWHTEESCTEDHYLSKNIFFNLPKPASDALNQITNAAAYRESAILFAEGQDARGIFVLSRGRVKLVSSTKQGRTVILRIANPGEVLGLTATIAERPYEATAEALEACEVTFFASRDLINFLIQHGQAAVNVARHLSRIYHRTHKAEGLASTAQARLAEVILNWANTDGNQDSFHLQLTHEEISQLIRTSRETVTRALGVMKRRKLIQIRGSHLVLLNREALEELAST